MERAMATAAEAARLSGRRALVTGANRGIGRAIAARLAESGAEVIAAARRPEDAAETAAALGDGVVGAALPLDDPGAAAARIAEIEAAHGPVDILVNNAAVLDEGDVLSVSLDAIERSLAVNAVAPVALGRTVGEGMRARGWGRIVNISSGWGAFNDGLTGPAAYSLSKAALNAGTVLLARALGPAVKVNAACPGWVRTRMGGAGATRSPEEAADTPVWLAALDSDGPTGGFFRDRKEIPW